MFPFLFQVSHRTRSAFAVLAAALLALAAAGCGGDSGSPSVPAPAPAPPPAPTPAPEPEPTKDDPAAYTQAFVQRAVDLYNEGGLDAILETYNDPASADEEWYVFIADEDNIIIAHPVVPGNVGDSLLGPLGVDSAGNIFGPALVAAGPEGAWVPYNYFNPATGDEGVKHAWAVRHEGLLFASGWYEGAPTDSSPAARTKGVVQQAANRIRDNGLEEALAFYSTPASTNGSFYISISNASGVIVSHGANPDGLIGKSLHGAVGVDVTGKVFGPDFLVAPPEGGWVEYAFHNPATGAEGSKHSWVRTEADHLIVSGWYESGAVEEDQDAYATGLVELAIRYARAEGEAASISFHGSDASTLGSWYVFLVRSDGEVVADPVNPDSVGQNANELYTPDFSRVTADGRWVSFQQANPDAGGAMQTKRVFARRHGRITYAAGYFTP